MPPCRKPTMRYRRMAKVLEEEMRAFLDKEESIVRRIIHR
jgi:hypothetical protein